MFAGHGTIRLEILLNWPEMNVIVVPAGRGLKRPLEN
jgi:threonine dehydratase